MSCTRNSDVTMSLELMPLYRRTCCRGYPQILTLKHQQTQTTQSKSESRSMKSPCLSSTGLNSLLGSVFSVIRPMREYDVTFDLLNLSPAVEGMIFARSAVNVSWLVEWSVTWPSLSVGKERSDLSAFRFRSIRGSGWWEAERIMGGFEMKRCIIHNKPDLKTRWEQIWTAHGPKTRLNRVCLNLPLIHLNKQVKIYLNLFIHSFIYQPTALVMDNK